MATKNKKSAKKDNSVVKKITIPKAVKVNKIQHNEISTFGSLGREIKISPKANITVNHPGYKIEFFVDTVTVLIGIGKDNTADLVMTKDAWEALKNGEAIDITTNKQFKENFL